MNIPTASILQEKLSSYYQWVDESVDLDPITHKVQRTPEIVSRITDIFADNAIYLRDGSRPFTNKRSIAEFLHDKRSLVGQHTYATQEQITNLSDVKGLKELYPDTQPSDVTCIRVKGHFDGAQFTTSELNEIESAHDLKVPFTDYWVFDKDNKVIYRYSHIPQLEKGRCV